MPGDALRIIAELFASEGAADYLGEPVTQARTCFRRPLSQSWRAPRLP